MPEPIDKPVFRFAPSPNGALHLGHAYSALLNHRMARAAGGRFLLRIEDIDQTRCSPALEHQMLEDLAWLGIEWDEAPRRQSAHFDDYRSALDVLDTAGLVYPAFMSRGELRRLVDKRENEGVPWPRDPDGAPHYPDDDRNLDPDTRRARIRAGDDHAWRLDMRAALQSIPQPIFWAETGLGPDAETGRIRAAPQAWGDVVLGRKDTPTSYHLSVVVDDALQGITHVVRGRDLFHATAVHRLLQELLGLPVPQYHHHDLILAADGRKLSKSDGDTSIRALRQAGATAADIRRMVGLERIRHEQSRQMRSNSLF